MIMKNLQIVYKIYFQTVLMTFICDVKIDIIMYKPHCFKLFFVNLLFLNICHIKCSYDNHIICFVSIANIIITNIRTETIDREQRLKTPNRHSKYSISLQASVFLSS